MSAFFKGGIFKGGGLLARNYCRVPIRAVAPSNWNSKKKERIIIIAMDI
jgi:hypothetical protein